MSNKKDKYFRIDEAVDEISYAYGVKGKAIASLKLFGKGIFNVGKFAATEIAPAAITSIANSAEKSSKTTDAQKQKAEELKNYAKTLRSEKK